MQKDFVTATPDTGGAGGTTVNVKASANSGAARNTTITVSGGGVSKQVSISQAAGQQVTVTGLPGETNGITLDQPLGIKYLYRVVLLWILHRVKV